MLLYHTTPARNSSSIETVGIRRRAGKIWLHDASSFEWALLHLAKHHKTNDLATYIVEIEPEHLRHVGGNPTGRFIYLKPIPTTHLQRID